MNSAFLGTQSASSPPPLHTRTYSDVHLRCCSHLSNEQVAELVRHTQKRPSLLTRGSNMDGVLSSSVSMTHGDSWPTLTDMPVSKANDILCASCRLYRHTEMNETIVRTFSYSVPPARCIGTCDHVLDGSSPPCACCSRHRESAPQHQASMNGFPSASSTLLCPFSSINHFGPVSLRKPETSSWQHKPKANDRGRGAQPHHSIVSCTLHFESQWQSIISRELLRRKRDGRWPSDLLHILSRPVYLLFR
jgi:hypothetical protein